MPPKIKVQTVFMIDGFYVKDMVTDPIDAAMVSAIIEIGHRMGTKTITEFVESEEILQNLRKLGVNYAQGYHIETFLAYNN